MSRWAALVGQGLTWAMLATVVWFVGPLLAFGASQPLESETARAALIACIAVLMLLRAARSRLSAWLHHLAPRLATLGRPEDWVVAAIVLATVGLISMFGVSYLRERSKLAVAQTQVQLLQRRVAAEPAPTYEDLGAVISVLQSLRGIAGDSGEAQRETAWGLGQAHRIQSRVAVAHQRMVHEALWPRLVQRIERHLRLQAAGNDTLRLYEALKVYLMLQRPEHFDAVRVTLLFDAEEDLFTTRERERASADAPSAAADRLRNHLEAAGAPPRPGTSDDALIARARERLAAVPLAERVRQRLRLLGAPELPTFNLVGVVGPEAGMVFTRKSGAPLTRGVPGFYSREGYSKNFRPKLDVAVKELAAEQPWVLGLTETVAAGSAPRTDASISDQVRRFYLEDYARAWESYLGDLSLAPTSSLNDLVRMTQALSGPHSILRPLLQAVSRETTLAEVAPKLDGAIAAARSSVLRQQAQPSAESLLLEQIVDEQFAALRMWVRVPEGRTQAPIDNVVSLIDELHRWLFATREALAKGEPPPRSDLPMQLRADAVRLPEPLRSWINELGVRSAALTGTGRARPN